MYLCRVKQWIWMFALTFDFDCKSTYSRQDTKRQKCPLLQLSKRTRIQSQNGTKKVTKERKTFFSDFQKIFRSNIKSVLSLFIHTFRVLRYLRYHQFSHVLNVRKWKHNGFPVGATKGISPTEVPFLFPKWQKFFHHEEISHRNKQVNEKGSR